MKAYYLSSKQVSWGFKFLTRPNWENCSSLAKSGFSVVSKIVINVVILCQKVKRGNRKTENYKKQGLLLNNTFIHPNL